MAEGQSEIDFVPPLNPSRHHERRSFHALPRVPRLPRHSFGEGGITTNRCARALRDRFESNGRNGRRDALTLEIRSSKHEGRNNHQMFEEENSKRTSILFILSFEDLSLFRISGFDFRPVGDRRVVACCLLKHNHLVEAPTLVETPASIFRHCRSLVSFHFRDSHKGRIIHESECK